MPYKNIRLKINNKTTYKREIFVISSCIKYKINIDTIML